MALITHNGQSVEITNKPLQALCLTLAALQKHHPLDPVINKIDYLRNATSRVVKEHFEDDVIARICHKTAVLDALDLNEVEANAELRKARGSLHISENLDQFKNFLRIFITRPTPLQVQKAPGRPRVQTYEEMEEKDENPYRRPQTPDFLMERVASVAQSETDPEYERARRQAMEKTHNEQLQILATIHKQKEHLQADEAFARNLQVDLNSTPPFLEEIFDQRQSEQENSDREEQLMLDEVIARFMQEDREQDETQEDHRRRDQEELASLAEAQRLQRIEQERMQAEALDRATAEALQREEEQRAARIAQGRAEGAARRPRQHRNREALAPAINNAQCDLILNVALGTASVAMCYLYAPIIVTQALIGTGAAAALAKCVYNRMRPHRE